MTSTTIRVRFPDGDRDWPTVPGIAGRRLPRPGDGWTFRKVEREWRAFADMERATA